MNAFFRLLLVCSVATAALVYAEDIDAESKDAASELDVIRDWINTKRQVTVKERGGSLSLSGEVRTELQSTNEKKDGIRQLGHGGAVEDSASRAFDVEFNLMLDYRAERTWGAVKVKFDNNAGTSSGTMNKISLSRAYLGGRALSRDTYTVDVEFGRQNLSSLFDSQVQFSSTFDGIVVKYDQAFDRLGDFFVHAGPFLVDERVDQYAFVGEAALLNVLGSGWYAKCSLIDWNTKTQESLVQQRRFRFLNIQGILGYKFRQSSWNKLLNFYVAALSNLSAHPLPIPRSTTDPSTLHDKFNHAYYAGFSIGEIKQKGDFALNVCYQYVEPQAVPGFDVSGIGRGNAAGTGLYSTQKDGSGDPTTLQNAGGNSNYKGFAVEFVYLLTSNWTVFQSWKQSVNQTSQVGPSSRYKQYEIELIYAF